MSSFTNMASSATGAVGSNKTVGWKGLANRRGARRAAIGLILPVMLVLYWWLASSRGWLPEQILPSPAYVYTTAVEMIVSGEIAYHAGMSLRRVVYGFLFGAMAGLSLGMAMGLSRTVDDYVRPLFLAFAQIPTLGWIPLLMLIFGIGEALKIIVIAKGALVPMTLNTAAGIRSVPANYVEVGRALRFSRLQTLRLIVLPGAAPSIFTGVRYGLTHSWTALVGVELLASSEGLGYLLVWGRQMFWLDVVIVAMIVIGIVGFVMDKGFDLAESYLQRWKRGEA
ncbi:sulfonate transport system permease protein [Phyllobacterium myrsinacearum]|uniref:ABC transporter permease n=1 Tax=Phyllobacterium myrsinacearum TaxID=28101 RepID=UPI0010F16EC0|nr:ABC transporter permease [Phyllobacterium myrsinacearum]RZS72814.1 sulfonate transport system permease protein [Phyllobacterium myrsinacearum]